MLFNQEDGSQKADAKEAAISSAAVEAKTAGRRRKSTRLSSVASDSSAGGGNRRRKSRTISESERVSPPSASIRSPKLLGYARLAVSRRK